MKEGTSIMYRYYAFGLTIHSELSFPELLPYSTSKTSDQDQVAIKFGEVSHHGLAGSNQSSNFFYQATKSAFWLHVPNVARFLITDGNQIIIDPVAGIDQDSLRLFVLGSCMGALLMQRDLFLLHGNAIKVGKHCISVVGNSGAGKSTLSAAFFKRGYSILADDVCAINPMHPMYQVIPSYPQIKLWLDAANHLDIATQTLRKIRPCAEKFAVPLGHQFYRGSLPLKLVYVLNSHSRDEISFTNLSGIQKLQSLRNNTYRKNYLKGLARHHLHFEQCAQIANQIMVVHIDRPDKGFKLNELVNLIENDLIGRGLHDADTGIT